MSASIVIIEDDKDLGHCMVEIFETLENVTAFQTSSLQETRREEDRVLKCALAIIDVNLGPDQPSGIDVYDWMLKSNFAGKIVFLTGHAKDHPLVLRSKQLGNVPVYSKPLGINQILELGRNL